MALLTLPDICNVGTKNIILNGPLPQQKASVIRKRVAAAAKVTDLPSTIKITCDNAPPRTDDPPLKVHVVLLL